MNKTEINQLLKEISRPSQSGIILSEVLEKIARILQADYIAYYEVQWHMSQLRLSEAHPKEYRKLIESDTHYQLKVPEENSPDFEGLGLSVLAFHDFIRDSNREDWNPVYVPDIKNPPNRYSGVYKLFKADIQSEIAIPIAQIFNGVQERLPLGVLLISSKHANHFNRAMKTKNNIVRITSRAFTTAACWEYLLRIDNTWKNIYTNISMEVNCDNYDKYFDLVLNSLGNSVTKAIKYSTLWTIGTNNEENTLVLQHVKDFMNKTTFDPEGAYTTICRNNNIGHTFYKTLIDIDNRIRKSDLTKISIADILKSSEFTKQSFKLKDNRLVLANKKHFQDHYKLGDEDRLNIIPLFSHYNDTGGDQSITKLVGLLNIYTAKDSQNFLNDFNHLEMFSFIVGNGIYNILRNKRRRLTNTISKSASGLINKFEEFLQSSVDYLRSSIKCQWIGIFLYDSANSIIILGKESTDQTKLGVKLEISTLSDPNSFLNKVINKASNGNSGLFISPTELRRFLSLYGDNTTWKNEIRQLLPTEKNQMTSFPCMIAPICLDNICRGVVIAINPLRFIDTELNDIKTRTRITSFSNEDIGLLTHFADTMAPVLSIHYFASEAMFSSVLQGHEIVSQARSITNKAEKIRYSASPIIIGFPWHDVDLMRKAIMEINLGTNITINAQTIHNSIDKVLKHYSQWNTDKAISQISDIERSSRIILFLSELRQVMNMEKAGLIVRLTNINTSVLERLQQIYQSQFEDDIKFLILESKIGAINMMTDPSKLDLVFWNLVSNALYYSYECSTTKIKTNRINSNEIEVKVTNFGIGIKQVDIDSNNIWQLNWRSTNARALRQEGTGVGLAVVSHILKNLELGSIRVTSEFISNHNLFLIYFVNKLRPNFNELDNAPRIELTSVETSIIRQSFSYPEIESKIEKLLIKKICEGEFKDMSIRRWKLLLNRSTYKTEFIVKIHNQKLSEV